MRLPPVHVPRPAAYQPRARLFALSSPAPGRGDVGTGTLFSGQPTRPMPAPMLPGRDDAQQRGRAHDPVAHRHQIDTLTGGEGEALDARNNSGALRSSGTSARGMHCIEMMRSFWAGAHCLRSISVKVAPGKMAFTVMPSALSSRAIDGLIPASARLARYAGVDSLAGRGAQRADAILMMRPHPARRIAAENGACTKRWPGKIDTKDSITCLPMGFDRKDASPSVRRGPHCRSERQCGCCVRLQPPRPFRLIEAGSRQHR